MRWLLVLATGLIPPLLPEVEVRAELSVESRDIRVGDRLQALHDLSLDEAIVAQGSKVSVSGRRSVNGMVVLDVALADGHVVKGLPLPRVRRDFQRVAD